MESMPSVFYAHFIKTRGQETFERMVRESHVIPKFSNADLEQKLAELAQISAPPKEAADRSSDVLNSVEGITQDSDKSGENAVGESRPGNILEG